MKKIVSAIAVSSMMLASISAVSAAETNPFDNFSDAEVIATDAPLPEGTVTSTGTTDTAVTSAEVAIKTEVVESSGSVMFKVSLDQEATEIKGATVVINFPDVVTAETVDIKNGELLDTIDTDGTKIEGTTLTYVASNLAAVPAKGELFTVNFKVKPGTVEQEYPFSVDVVESKLVNKLNEDVKTTSAGVDMVKLKSETKEVKEVKKETGFETNVMLLLALLGASTAAFAGAKRRSL